MLSFHKKAVPFVQYEGVAFQEPVGKPAKHENLSWGSVVPVVIGGLLAAVLIVRFFLS
jgi:hypothetical protein